MELNCDGMDRFDETEKEKLEYVKQKESVWWAKFGAATNEAHGSDFMKKMYQTGINHQKLIREKEKKILSSRRNQMDQSKCASCNRTFVEKGSTCSACMKVSYCNKKCQLKHWKEHKKDCKLFKMFANDDQY